ncbi:GTP cyclohydrolase 1 type 2 [Geobacter sp. SVR]|nr:GTP cyclohydrolase 1 type 2 [Geobacter sp. SVR]
MEVSRIMVALDATQAVVDDALSAGCQLLVTHHPLLFKPQKVISTATTQGRLVHTAIRGGLAIFSMHTNYDIDDGGLNDVLAERLGLPVRSVLQATAGQELVKLVVFVPEGHLDQLRTALFPYAQQLGAYRDCSFAAAGEGTFTPLSGATPFIGAVGEQERVAESRLEVLIDRTAMPRAVKALLSAHPYEEPAFDVYPLLNEGRRLGLGRIGVLPESTTLSAFAARVAQKLGAPALRYVGSPEAVVSKVALCSGSGASVMQAAVRGGADVLVTGDVKYHEARDAEAQGIALIDAGHFATEIIMVDAVADRLARMLSEAGYMGCEIVPCRCETDPFRYC